MKSYNHLWEKFISEENIRASIIKAAKGKLKRKNVMHYINNIDESVNEIQEYVMNFHNISKQEVTICDRSSGKKRQIIVPDFKEHIVHHMVVSAMNELLTKGMYKHSYSSIPGRGLHKCMKTIRRWILSDPASVKYCLKLDIRKFFNSIDHNILKAKFHKYIHDDKFLSIVDTIIDASPNGIPLGFYTSHWFANWLLQPLDHYIKEKLNIKYYARYMDDIVIFGSNKRNLHKVKKSIEQWLNDMNLELKDNWQLFRFDYVKDDKHYGCPLDFVGFKFYRDKIILRKRLMLRITRKVNKILKKRKFTIHDTYQLMAGLGWMEWADVYKVYMKYIAPYITKKKCQKRISKYTRRQNNLEKILEDSILK